MSEERKSIAHEMFPAYVPTAVSKEPTADPPTRRMFDDPEVHLRQEFLRWNDDLRDAGFTQTEIAAFRHAHIDAIREADLPSRFGRALIPLTTEATLAARRGVTPDAQQQHTLAAEARRGVRTTYEAVGWSASDVDAVLDRTERFITSQPKLAALLQPVGLRAETLLALVDHVRRLPAEPTAPTVAKPAAPPLTIVGEAAARFGGQK